MKIDPDCNAQHLSPNTEITLRLTLSLMITKCPGEQSFLKMKLVANLPWTNRAWVVSEISLWWARARDSLCCWCCWRCWRTWEPEGLDGFALQPFIGETFLVSSEVTVGNKSGQPRPRQVGKWAAPVGRLFFFPPCGPLAGNKLFSIRVPQLFFLMTNYNGLYGSFQI